jgi:hypothetical protein
LAGDSPPASSASADTNHSRKSLSSFKGRLVWNEYLVTAVNMVLNFVTEFLYQRFFVFGGTIDTRPPN